MEKLLAEVVGASTRALDYITLYFGFFANSGTLLICVWVFTNFLKIV